MSYDEDTLDVDAAEEAAGNNDIVTNDELQEIHCDLNLDAIQNKLSEEQAFADAQDAQQPEEEPRFEARQGRKTYHTGPKGVLTDYEEAKLKLRAKRLQQKLNAKKRVYMQLDNCSDVTPFKFIDVNLQKLSVSQLRRETNSKEEEYSDEDDASEELKIAEEEFDDIPDEILEQYKLQMKKTFDKYHERYGSLKECNVFSFVEQVEKAPPNVFTVMHVYQDYLERCVQLNQALSKIANAHKYVQFLRARSDRIGLDKYPDLGIPTLIIWQNGKQIKNFVAFHREIENFSIPVVEKFLMELKVIERQVILPEKPSKNCDENRRTLDMIRKRLRRKKQNKVQRVGNGQSCRNFGEESDEESSSLDLD